MGDYCYICSDYLYDCDYVCEASDEDNLMEQISEHFASAHNHLDFNPETKKQIEEVIKKPAE